MDVTGRDNSVTREVTGAEIHALASRIFPICRSITGQGVRDTLAILREHIPLTSVDIASGTRVYDWTVPDEWIVRDAYIRAPSGEKVVDFARSNLHLMNYSVPVRKVMPLYELKSHIHTLPEQPDVIPYKTAYYTDAWGFCMSHAQFRRLPEQHYDIVIDTEKRPGALTYGEYLHRGESSREVLFYAHICHPSLANDNCSGLATLTLLAAALRGRKTHYSYRFVFAPGTIGSLSWLSRNEDRLSNIAAGLVVSCIGDAGGPHYKQSRRGDAMIDRILPAIRCGDEEKPVGIAPFSPYGYDERQFCSPGFNLPVGLLQRSKFGSFPEYHTSADNLDFITPKALGQSFRMLSDIVEVLERNTIPLNLSPKGEPQLGRYGLFPAIGGHKTNSQRTMAYLWLLNMADGTCSLLDIAEKSGLSFAEISAAADALCDAGLLASHGFCRC